MISRLGFAALVLVFAVTLPGFSAQMKARPIEVKLGYQPHPRVIRLLSGEFSPLVAELSVVNVLFYFGTLVDKWEQNVIIRPEYQNMYRALVAATELDPYNQDAYYFAQAAFTWELGRVAEVNFLLERGMQARPWDHWLPFYIAFNNAYFLKDYAAAAKFMQISAELSGDPLRAQLASRYLYESNRTAMAIAFLDTMITQEKNVAVIKAYQMRKDALVAMTKIETAVSDFSKIRGRNPRDLDELFAAGMLHSFPQDPYGGKFYLDENARVRTTSNLAGEH